MLKNKTLLITGGTGSFGNAVMNKYLSSGIKEIRILRKKDVRIFKSDQKFVVKFIFLKNTNLSL